MSPVKVEEKTPEQDAGNILITRPGLRMGGESWTSGTNDQA